VDMMVYLHLLMKLQLMKPFRTRMLARTLKIKVVLKTILVSMSWNSKMGISNWCNLTSLIKSFRESVCQLSKCTPQQAYTPCGTYQNYPMRSFGSTIWRLIQLSLAPLLASWTF
jgi:hypothetical protein